ncbi:MAG TPA: helix-turn-helix domain-containing protein [Candidatus Scatavimonas merdigallinarum]|uniref:Helix-turn-helix domain-containing protein n=1 Tax=Candidatus Scatavimonas merdigallinarum TaxID=2840914 RepID=A0A9D0ZHQ0_9FIRM|nr:helix-turn-helix domain-containing protein [Candidatus Scatavimonas merdigallinarum]
MHISYKPLWHTLVRICETLNCGILDVIELEPDEITAEITE